MVVKRATMSLRQTNAELSNSQHAVGSGSVESAAEHRLLLLLLARLQPSHVTARMDVRMYPMAAPPVILDTPPRHCEDGPESLKNSETDCTTRR